MGKKDKKTAKGRLDKYYKLAKEQGYRARSAFKLVQLDSKYEFLKGSRCTVDLCAAPGGWLQVCTKQMPRNSLILGVDLTPIKPIPNVITAQHDITTDECRAWIRSQLHDWKADVVLHDGAPNVGTAWVQDAFSQAELVLSSLKLATEILVPGGAFVTKVFRSKDYNSLLWVLNQLFGKVEATKPPSSRNVSAEIFLVCRSYKAPKKIDPRFLQPSHVFRDLDVMASAEQASTDKKGKSKAGDKGQDHETNVDEVSGQEADDPKTKLEKKKAKKAQKLTPQSALIFQPEKSSKKRKREGYGQGEDTPNVLWSKGGVGGFIEGNGEEAVELLGKVGVLEFDGEEGDMYRTSKHTTPEILELIKDLRILGKKEFKTLLKWRRELREEAGLDVKRKDVQEDTGEVEKDEDEKMQEELDHLKSLATSKKRQDRRRANERKTRDIKRMQLGMTTPMDIGIEAGEQGLGDLFEIDDGDDDGKEVDEDYSDDDEDEGSDGDEDEDEDETSELKRVRSLENELESLYQQFQEHRLQKDTSRGKVEARRKQRQKRIEEEGGEWGGIGKKKFGDGDEEDEGEEDSESEGWEGKGGEEESDEDVRKVLEAKVRKDAEEDSSSDEEEEDEDAEEGVQGDKRRKVRFADDVISSKPIKKTKQQKQKEADDAKKKRNEAEERRKDLEAKMWFDQAAFEGVKGLEELLQGDDEEEVEDESLPKGALKKSNAEKGKGKESSNSKSVDMDTDADIEEVARDEAALKNEEVANAKRKRQEELGLATAEAMTVASQLVNGEKNRDQLIDDGFNRHAYLDKDGLPPWFLEDEQKHFRNNIPVTKEAINIIRDKMRALDARPIKKVAEAKARKKMRAQRRVEKLKKQAIGIQEGTGDMSEREKQGEIEKIMGRMKNLGKGGGKGGKTKKETKLVVAKGANKGKGRPGGVKGKYKMVDSRLKKDTRALKRIEKAQKGRKGSKVKGGVKRKAQ